MRHLNLELLALLGDQRTFQWHLVALDVHWISTVTQNQIDVFSFENTTSLAILGPLVSHVAANVLSALAFGRLKLADCVG